MLHCRKANAILILSVGLKIWYMIAVRDYFDRFIIILTKYGICMEVFNTTTNINNQTAVVCTKQYLIWILKQYI